MAREEFRHTSAQTSLSTFQYSQQETPLESSQLPDSYIYIYIYIYIKQEIALKCIFKSELLCAKACDDANSYIHLTLYTNIHTYAYMYVCIYTGIYTYSLDLRSHYGICNPLCDQLKCNFIWYLIWHSRVSRQCGSFRLFHHSFVFYLWTMTIKHTHYIYYC